MKTRIHNYIYASSLTFVLLVTAGIQNVLGQVPVAPHYAMGGREDQVDVPRHQFAKCRLGAFLCVLLQQLSVVRHHLFND